MPSVCGLRWTLNYPCSFWGASVHWREQGLSCWYFASVGIWDQTQNSCASFSISATLAPVIICSLCRVKSQWRTSHLGSFEPVIAVMGWIISHTLLWEQVCSAATIHVHKPPSETMSPWGTFMMRHKVMRRHPWFPRYILGMAFLSIGDIYIFVVTSVSCSLFHNASKWALFEP